MGHRRAFSTTSENRTPVPVPDYIVSGLISPDAKGEYFKKGEYAGKPYCQRKDGNFYIFAFGGDYWYIAAILGDTSHGGWISFDTNITGPYDYEDPASGIAYVAAGGI
jgi:hypothetical protein